MSAAGLVFRTSGAPQHHAAALVGVGARPLFFFLTAFVLLLALVLGGAASQGMWSDGLIQIVSLVLIGVLVFTPRPALRPGEIWAYAIIAAAVALPLLQLIPLPPAIWTRLPGRDSITAAYEAAGTGLPWLPVSLDPGGTIRAVVSLLPPVAVFLAVVLLGATSRRTLTLLIIAVGIVSVGLGLTQRDEAIVTTIYPFPVVGAVGFFANVNHQAAFLYSLMTLTAAWIVGFLYERRPQRTLALIISGLIYVGFLLGLGVVLSRAGILLGVGAALASLAIAGRNDSRVGRWGIWLAAAGVVIGASLLLWLALIDVQSQFGENPLADLRVVLMRTTLAAGSAFQPVGSGFGSFVDAYQIFENTPDLTRAYANEAHDDWLQIWMEGGWAGVAILLAFLGWFATASWRVWRVPSSRRGVLDRAVPQAATIVVLLLMLHSTLEYPLRTTALSTLLAFCCALLIAPVRRPEGEETPARAADQARDATREPGRSRRNSFQPHRRRHGG